MGIKSLQEFLAYAKKNPQGINFCSAGNGSINHLSGELFKAKTGRQHDPHTLQGQWSSHHRSDRWAHSTVLL
jgi:tripartite-type tricarboxylate transporter receptor subunit TctC